MYIYEGKSVFGGIAIGKISVYKKEEQQVRRVKAADTEAEITRFRMAKAEAIRCCFSAESCSMEGMSKFSRMFRISRTMVPPEEGEGEE